jgi:hypothetical protein
MALSACKVPWCLRLVALVSLAMLLWLLMTGCDRDRGKSDLRPADESFRMARIEGIPVLADLCSLISIAQARRVLDIQDSDALRLSSTDYRCEFRVDRGAGEEDLFSLALLRLTGAPRRIEKPGALAASIARALDWPQAPRYAGRLDGSFLFVSDSDGRITRVLLTTPHRPTAMEAPGRLLIIAELVKHAPSTARRVEPIQDIVDQLLRRLHSQSTSLGVKP